MVVIMTTTTAQAPATISRPRKLPFLESICWQTKNVYQFTPEQMLRRYERGWKYRTLCGGLEETELNFLRELAQRYKSWLQVEL